MSGRLLLIEARRSVGLWVLLALPLWAWLNRQLPDVAPFWSETSVIIRNTVGFVGPLLGGAAAWMAGREARRGLGDLLATTARPQLARRLTTWAGAVAWGGCAYLLSAAIVAGFGLARATWGGPFVGPIAVGLVAVPVYAALGFALGRWFPGRFTAPMATIALLVAPAMVGAAHGPYAFLSPVVSLSQSVWYGVGPDLAGFQIAFFLGLGGAALATLALPAPMAWRGVAIGAIALGTLAVATVALWSAAPVHGGQELSVDPRYRALVPLPYTLVCADAPLPVCVHPAYRASLGEVTATLNTLVAPVLGLPGVPTRAEQGYANVQGQREQSGATLWFDVGPPLGAPRRPILLRSAVYGIILDPRRSSAACPSADGTTCLRAQEVLGTWLLREAGGGDGETVGVPGDMSAIAPAVGRFSALDPRVRRDWLAAHFADLRAGHVRLEDMP